MAESEEHVKCHKCNKKVNLSSRSAVQCSGICKQWFHRSCGELVNKSFKETKKNKDSWICSNCKDKRKTMSPIPAMSNSSRKSFDRYATTIIPRKSINNTRGSNLELSHKNKSFNEEITLDTINKKIDTMMINMSSVKKEVSELKTLVHEYQNLTDQLMGENEQLRNANFMLRKDVRFIEYKVEKQKQELLDRNIALCGVDQKDDENLKDIAGKLLTGLAVEYQDNDIDEVYRIPTFEGLPASGLSPPIIIKFKNRCVRDLVFQQRKIKQIELQKNLDTSILGYKTQVRPIYISEQLTPYFQFLFKRARDIKRENIVKYAWVKNGKILVKKDEGKCPTIELRHKFDLHQFNGSSE